MTVVIQPRLVAKRRKFQLPLGAYQGIHTAAGDVIHMSLSTAHTQQGIDKFRLSPGQEGHHPQGVDALGTQAGDLRVLPDGFLHQKLTVLCKPPVQGLKIRVRAGLQPLYPLPPNSPWGLANTTPQSWQSRASS